VHEQET